ncbi:MAG TPA: hypothetical protein VK903_08140 [Propionicimonas sp.]|nr:hypothetical protein [Propionicimonas sp.]
MRIDRRQLGLLAVVGILTGLSLLLRVPCFAWEPTGLALAVPGCHGDLAIMWESRGLAAGNIPYLQPFVDPLTGQLVTVEYPVLTGMLMWLVSRAGSLPAFVAWSAVLMGTAAMAIALILGRLSGRRAWLWAAAPALVHYLAYGYDALAVLTVVAALAMVVGDDAVGVRARSYLGAAAVLGIGGGLKFYPLLFVLPLALWLLFGRPGPLQPELRLRLGRALAVIGVTTGVFVAVNLPFALTNPQGWWLPFSFQAGRPIDVTTLSIWYFAGTFWPAVSQSQWMLLSTVATAVGIGAAAGAGWLVGQRRGAYPLLGSCVTVLIAYVLLNKVFSPQFILWLLPLLVLVRLPARLIVFYLALDVAMFWALGFTPYLRERGLVDAMPTAVGVLLLTVLLRAGLLVRVAFSPTVQLDAPRDPSAASV